MYFSADTFFILKNHGSIKGAILGNAKGGEHSPPFVRFPSNYCTASYSPPSHSAKAPLKTPASCSGLLYFTVWNRLEEEHGDYKTVAHIAPDRTVTIYDEEMPQAVREEIQRMRKSPSRSMPIWSITAWSVT